jgi:hypothetical protein
MVEITSNPFQKITHTLALQSAAASNKLVAQAVINQTRSAAVTPVRVSAVPQSAKNVRSESKVLPRGSLLDITA